MRSLLGSDRRTCAKCGCEYSRDFCEDTYTLRHNFGFWERNATDDEKAERDRKQTLDFCSIQCLRSWVLKQILGD